MQEKWEKAVQAVRKKNGFPAKRVKHKKCFLVAAVLEELWGNEFRSPTLERLCRQVLTLAETANK